MEIQTGWAFYSADFSGVATGFPGMTVGNVLLIRDIENKAKWHEMSDEDKESPEGPPLYVQGVGRTFEDAIANANAKAALVKDIEE